MDSTERSPDIEDAAPRPGDALCVVDLQRDFLPGGALPVAESDAIVPAVNRLVELFARRGVPVVASRDWHPPDHCSFQENGGKWPVHCVAGTSGAMFAAGLKLPELLFIISKGTDRIRDAYSAFEGTGLSDRLHELGIRRLFVCGVATDVCVLATVRDAVDNDFQVVLLTDAIRAVNQDPEDGERAVREMRQLGARMATSDDVLRSAESP